ncbi:MAG: GntR family transcriptional regulator [Chloroflexota bacterium]|nr:GntR family transcriptional regulator [Chloroflexota bacterium]
MSTKLAARSKREAVYEWILACIVEGEFAPNTPLVIDELARNLDISPIPVREAMQQLESEGFVVIRPYTGVMVADLKPSMITEIFGLLETAEIISGRMACINICDDELAEVEMLLTEMDDLIDDPDRWSQANTQFHQLICTCSGATLVAEIMAHMLLHWDRVRRHYLDDVFGKRIEKAHQDHWKMLDAIKAQDADRLEAVVRDHNRSALRDYISYLHRSGYSDEQVPVIWDLSF